MERQRHHRLQPHRQSTTGANVNGTPHSGAVDLRTGTAATATQPSSSGNVTYTFTVTATGGTGATPATRPTNATVAPGIVLYSGTGHGFNNPAVQTADANDPIWITHQTGASVTEIR